MNIHCIFFVQINAYGEIWEKTRLFDRKIDVDLQKMVLDQKFFFYFNPHLKMSKWSKFEVSVVLSCLDIIKNVEK